MALVENIEVTTSNIKHGRVNLQTFLDNSLGGDPSKYGGVGDGIADDSAALQAALDTGYLNTGDSSKVWRVTRTITGTGTKVVHGEGTIVSDFKGTLADPAFAIKVTDGNDSIVTGSIKFTTGTVPYTIRRNEGWVMIGTAEQRFDGYIPTPQDIDIWSGVSAEIRTHNERIGTGILFISSSATPVSNVLVEGVRGNQVNIVLQGCINSTVRNVNCGLGQFTLGGIYIHNGVGRAYNQAILGYTLPRGTGNRVESCTVKYSSLCGICFTGQDQHFCVNNHSTSNAESGIKTSQYDAVAGISESMSVVSTRGNYSGNYVGYNYYDGLDLQSIYGAIFSFVYAGHSISNNIMERNRLTGMHTNGAYCLVESNFANLCGDTGVAVTGTGCTVANNRALDCAIQSPNAQAFGIAVQGDDCVSYGNYVKQQPYVAQAADYSYIHTGLLGAAPTGAHEGLDYGNYVDEGAARMFISPTIAASKTSRVTSLSTTPVVNISTNYTVGIGDYSFSCFTTSGAFVQMPSAASFPGRILKFRNTSAYAILSNTADIGQIQGGAPTNTILPATNGSWVELQSNGSVWLVMARGSAVNV